jgi:ketosteroid isomerase-like protein
MRTSRAASAAFGRGDLAALRDQFFADNIVWHVAGTGPLAGDYAGADRVIRAVGACRPGFVTFAWTASPPSSSPSRFGA